MPLFGPPDIAKLEAKRDVNGLTKALGYQKDPTVRRRAADALGGIRDLSAVEPLIASLADTDHDVRAAITNALGQIGDERAVNPLVAKLDDKDPAVREAISKALCRIGHPSVEPLLSVLKRGDRRAAEILGEIGDPRALADLDISLGDNRDGVSAAAADALGKFNDPRAIEFLIRGGLESRDEDTCKAAVAALRKLGWIPDGGRAAAAWWIAQDEWAKCTGVGAPAVEPLVEMLTNRGTDWRSWERQAPRQYAAARALAGIIDPLAVEPLIAILGRREHLDDRLIESIARALGGIADPRAAAPLVRALVHGDPGKTVTAALVRIGVPAVPALIAALWNHPYQDGQRTVYAGVVVALNGIGSAAVEPLVAALGNADEQIRRGTVAVLGQIGDQRAVEPLIASLGDADEQVRRDAAGVLGQFAAPRAVEPLVGLACADASFKVRMKAAEALGKIGWTPDRGPAAAVYWITVHDWSRCLEIGAPAVEPLIATLEEGYCAQDAAKTLGEIGDPRAVVPLTAALTARNEAVARAAAAALERMGVSPGHNNVQKK